jgi:hypothetical protein
MPAVQRQYIFCNATAYALPSTIDVVFRFMDHHDIPVEVEDLVRRAMENLLFSSFNFDSDDFMFCPRNCIYLHADTWFREWGVLAVGAEATAPILLEDMGSLEFSIDSDGSFNELISNMDELEDIGPSFFDILDNFDENTVGTDPTSVIPY